MHWVAHVYLANFYSSVQQGLQPEAVEQPLIILRHNRVLDVNKLAAELGVKLRTSRRHAFQLCPDGVYLNYAEEDYRVGVNKALTACMDYTPVIEPVVENEFYLELAGPHTPEQVIDELAQSLHPSCCSSLSVGIAANKLLAKVCNMALIAGRVQAEQIANAEQVLGKYYWLNYSSQPELDSFLYNLPVSYLWNLEQGSRDRLKQLGFLTIGEVAGLEGGLLDREFGRQAAFIRESASGQDFSRVLALYPPKNISKDLQFPGGLEDKLSIEQCLKQLAEQFAGELENQGCRKLGLELQLSAGSRRGNRSFSAPQNRAITFQEVLISIFNRMELNQPVHALTVTAEDLRPLPGVQLSLFADPKALAGKDKQQKTKLTLLLDNLGKRFTPHNFSLGKQEQLSRREQMLKYWDPLRFKER